MTVTNEQIKNLPPFVTMDDAIDAAAEHLPKGYRVMIAIERHGYGFHLETPDCDEVDIDGGDGLRSDVWEAIRKANGVNDD